LLLLFVKNVRKLKLNTLFAINICKQYWQKSVTQKAGQILLVFLASCEFKLLCPGSGLWSFIR